MKISTVRTSTGLVEKYIGTAYDNVKQVANSIDNINITAENIDDISTVSSSIKNGNFSSDSLEIVNRFTDSWQGIQAEDPTHRSDGSALQEGDRYFNSVTGLVRVWLGALWVESSDYFLTTIGTIQDFIDELDY